MIDSDFIKIKFTLPIMDSRPSRNGVIYPIEAREKALSSIKDMPIIIHDSEKSQRDLPFCAPHSRPVGICQEAKITEDGFEIEGILWAKYFDISYIENSSEMIKNGIHQVNDFSIMSVDII